MVTELLPNRISATVSVADAQQSNEFAQKSRAIYPSTPVVDDDTYKKMTKMGPVKRAEFDAKMLVMAKYKIVLASPLSIEKAASDIALMDAATKASVVHQDMADDYLRLATLGGVQSYNMMQCCEDDIIIQAKRGNETAIAALNELKAIDKQRKAELASGKAKVEALVVKKTEEALKKS